MWAQSRLGGTDIDKYAKVETMLEGYKMRKISIINMQKELDMLEEMDGITGIASGGGGGSSGVSNITERTALWNIEKRGILERRIKKAQLEVDKLERTIEGLNDVSRQIIKGFYFDDLKWWQVAYSVGYCERHCKDLRVKAIKEMVKGIYGIDG